MPIEVREVVIKASVADGDNNASAGGSDSDAKQPGEDMIKQCVEKVLEILKEKNER